MAFPPSVALLACALLLHTTDAACPSEGPTKNLLCYVEQINDHFDPCLCTHLVLQTPLEKLTPQSDLLKTAQILQQKNPALKLIAVASDLAETALKRRDSYAKSVSSVVDKCGLDGVEVDLRWGAKVAGKVQLVDLVQIISKEFKSLKPNARTKRDYKIYEQREDDVTTPRYTPPNSKTKPRKTRSTEGETKTETNTEQKKEDKHSSNKDIILRLSSEPQHLAKNFDLKRLSKYVDLFTIASDNLTDASEHGVTYHPSRLMGIQDILNADSMIDLLTGLGAPHEKLILSLPARALKFTLKDSKKNLPQSPVTGAPKYISQSELCTTMSEGNWTVERDEDLTAPYAFHESTWIAFDDPISTSIKGKYILLRDLAGGAVVSADAEDWSGKCNSSKPAVLATLYDTFTNIARKSRAAQLISLQEELHESAQYSYSGDIHLSPYRIVRVVDRAGDIHVVRKEAKTEFECSRQGYFTHPSGCNRFYRCVKFNQYTPDFTVFEYDCPAGLAFDERYEVCVWPGSLPDGGACQGSSEIAPVPRGRYVCPRVEGYYADPENCRWFFACLDHVRDGVTPLTAYEFRCPFGLVFNEKALVCDWPWLVEGCGGAGAFRATFTVGDFYEGRQRASYASLSDVHVSGGRIENVPGGVVLGSSVVGGLASGSNIYSSGAGLYTGGAYNAKGYSGGAYDYSGLSGASVGGAYSAGSGAAHEGGLYVAGGHSSGGGGLYSAGGSSGAYSGSAGGQSGSGLYSGGAYSGGAYSGGSGAYSGSSGAYSGGSGAYSGGQGSGYYVADGQSGGSAYSAGGGVGLVGVKSTSGYAGQYGGSSGAVNLGSSGVYGGGYSAGSGYASGGSGQYSQGSGTYSGGSAGQYVVGVNSAPAYGGVSGSSYEAGKFDGASHSGGYVASGGVGSVVYSGESGAEGYDGGYVGVADSGKYQGYSGASKGAYSSSSFESQSGNAGYQGPSYKLAGGYDAGISSTYHGGYGQKSISLKTPSAPVTLVSDAISSGYNHDLSGFNVLAEHKPVSFVNVGSVKVTPGSDVISGYGGYSTPAPLPAVSVTPAVSVSTYSSPVFKTVTQSPLSVSSYRPAVYQPTTPRPTTYYQSSSFGVTPAPVTYQRPVVSVTPTPYVSVTPSPISVSTYQPALIKTVTPAPISYRPVLPTVLKTPVVPLNPVQYSTPAPFSFGYSSPAPVQPLQVVSTPAPAPAISSVQFSYPKPSIGLVKTPVVPYNPVSYTFKQPVQFSTPAPAYISTVTQAPVSYREEYTYQKQVPLQPIQPVYQKAVPLQPVQVSTPAPEYVSTVTQAPVSYREEYTYQKQVPLQPIQPVYQKAVPLQPVQVSTPAPAYVSTVTQSPVVYREEYTYQKPIQPVYQKQVPLQPVYQKAVPLQPVQPVQYQQPAPGVSYSYTYNKPSEVRVPVPVTPAPIEINYSPSPATIVKPLEVKYAYPRPAVLKTPVVPLNPIQYSTPAPTFYSYEQNLPAQPVNYVKSIPRPAFRAPIQYSTPAPIAVEYPSPKPIQFRPAVLKTPVVPLNPVQYTTSAPVYYQSTPAPVTVQYQTPSYPKPVPFRPAVLKTPVVPLNPVQYTTSAPVYYESTPAQYLPPRPISSVNFGTAYKLPVKTVTQQPISIDYSYQQPAIKTPVTPVSIDYSSPAPIQQVEVNYNYPKPAVKFVEQPAFVSTTPAPAVYKTVSTVPMYQRVINAFKAPVVSAYQKVLDVISSSTPSTFIQPVTQSPVSYAPVNVGFSYNKPALVKTQSIPVTPVTVVPAYQKVLNVVKASTTTAPLYANHYTSTYEPVVISSPRPTVISESSYGLDNSNHGFEGNTDEFYEAVRQDFGNKLVGYKQEFTGYEYAKPVTKFTEGSFVQNVPAKSDVSYYTSTTAVPVVQETYRKQVDYEQPAYVGFESGKLAGYDQVVSKAPQEQYVQEYGNVGVQYGGSLGYSQVPVSTTPASVKGYSSGHVGFEYDGSVGYSQIPVTSTTPVPTVQITTARVSLPVVKSPLPTVDAYYTRRKQTRVRPVVVTENYPTTTFKSTVTPSTIFTPTYYSTTPAPVYSSTANYEDELEVEGEDEDDSAKLLEAYNGQFGGVLTKGVSVSGYSGESSTVANIKDGEAIVGVLKKGRVDYTGRKTKSKVVVVSRLSDFNPILVGKLGAECSCSPKSNTVSLRRGKTQLFSPNTYQAVPDQASTDYVTSTTTLSPESVNGYEEYGASFYSEKQVDNGPIVEIKPLVVRKTYSTTLAPLDAYSVSTDGVYVDPTPLVKLPKLRKTIKTYSENSLRPTYQEVLLPGKVGGSDFADAGKSFDRYGPGGLRGVDETLQGSVDCKRAGLFRHPKYCNKFYSCNWDQWKGRFTLHVLNCPVHLAYDSGLGACNWPSKGPACADDNLLV